MKVSVSSDLDVAFRVSTRAIYSCYIFCQKLIALCYVVIAMAFDVGQHGYSAAFPVFQLALALPPLWFLTLPLGLPLQSSSCLSCCHFLSEGTQWPCSQAVMLVRGVWVRMHECLSVCALFPDLSALPNQDLCWHAHSHQHTRLIFLGPTNASLSVYVHLCTHHVFLQCVLHTEAVCLSYPL